MQLFKWHWAKPPVLPGHTTTFLHERPPGDVSSDVTRFLVSLCLSVVCAWGAAPDTTELLKAVEARYNRAQTVQVLFEQTFTAQNRPQRTEAGELFLRKPGRMRWQYTSPKGKLFLSDGKDMYLYTPATNRVEKMKVKESDDLRAPLGFLLGKLDFWRDFQKFTSRPEDADVRITAEPKSNRSPYSQVEFVVTPAREIRYLKVIGQDRSVMEFHLSKEKLNPPLAESLFRFEIPPGTEVVNAISEQEGAR
jgi:outer membrane lipoprotein carrier protein